MALATGHHTALLTAPRPAAHRVRRPPHPVAPDPPRLPGLHLPPRTRIDDVLVQAAAAGRS